MGADGSVKMLDSTNRQLILVLVLVLYFSKVVVILVLAKLFPSIHILYISCEVHIDYQGDNRKNKEWNTIIITLQSFRYKRCSPPRYNVTKRRLEVLVLKQRIADQQVITTTLKPLY